MVSRSFILFVLVGVIAAAVNIIARYFINFAVSFELAIVLAFPIALSVAFVLNRAFVFKSEDKRVAGQYGRFLLVNLLMLCQVWVVSICLARFVFPAIGLTWHSELLAHIIGVGSPIVTSYFAHKHFSFRTA